MLKYHLVSSDLSIRDGLKRLNDIHNPNHQIIFVIDKQEIVLGTVTNGDIRRGLINEISLNESISKIMQKDFVFLKNSASENDAMIKMKKEKLNQIPKINKFGKLIDLFFIDDLKASKDRKNVVFIMAGGKGERLKPITNNFPKPMLLVSGKPMLEIIINQFIQYGFTNFLISVHYLKDKIINYFGDGKKWGVKIKYIEEHKPLGTAGSLGMINEYLNEPFFCINADIISKVNYLNLLENHIKSNFEATMCIRENIIQLPYGVVTLNENKKKVTRIDEKPYLKNYINAGIYVFNPNIIDIINKNEFTSMTQFLNKLLYKKHKINSFLLKDYWIDAGRHDTLEEARIRYDTLE